MTTTPDPVSAWWRADSLFMSCMLFIWPHYLGCWTCYYSAPGSNSLTILFMFWIISLQVTSQVHVKPHSTRNKEQHNVHWVHVFSSLTLDVIYVMLSSPWPGTQSCPESKPAVLSPARPDILSARMFSPERRSDVRWMLAWCVSSCLTSPPEEHRLRAAKWRKILRNKIYIYIYFFLQQNLHFMTRHTVLALIRNSLSHIILNEDQML